MGPQGERNADRKGERKMKKIEKKQLLDAMLSAGNYFGFRAVCNSLGITHLTRAETEGMMKSYLLRRPDMKPYYDDSNNNSLFCGLWFAEKTMVFDAKEEDIV
jgi:hypothetical protein